MARRTDKDGGAWIQGGTARIPARGEPFGGPPLIDDTPPEIKEHLNKESLKEGSFFAADKLAELYGSHQSALAEERKTTTLAGAKGLTERVLAAYDADVLTAAEAAPNDEARQRFTDDALDLRRALEAGAAETETRFHDMGRRSALQTQAGALGRQAAAYPEDYALHAAMLDKVAAGAAALVKPGNAAQFHRVEAEKVARGAVMGFIDQGRFDEGRALLATATDGGPGALALPADAVKELGGVLETRRVEAAAREKRLDRVDRVLEGTAAPAEDGEEWKQLVEEHYRVVAENFAKLDPVERSEVEDDYVRTLGHLPQPLMRSLRAGMLSGEADHEAAAALRIKTLAGHDPALVAAIPERARAQAIAGFAELGLKPERAVELGDEKLQEPWSRHSKEPEGPRPEPLMPPEDDIGDHLMPLVRRPGYVWENGGWRRETPAEEARDNFQPLSESGDGGTAQQPAADATEDSSGPKKQPSPQDDAAANKDGAGDKDQTGTAAADEPGAAEPKEEKDKGELGGLPPAGSLFQGRSATIRDDEEGDGHYGTNRTDKNDKKHHHAGVNLNAEPGEAAAVPVDGTVEMIGDPYGDKQFKSVWIKTESGHRIGMLYVTPHDGNGKQLVKPGDKVKAGDVIGTVQDITTRYPNMNNHVHFEVRKGKGRGKPLDPTPWLRSSGVIE